MRDVRKRSDKTDNMFEPLRDTVALLTRFGITMTEVVLKQLEEGPLAWKSLKKKMFQRCCFCFIHSAEQEITLALMHLCPLTRSITTISHLARLYMQGKCPSSCCLGQPNVLLSLRIYHELKWCRREVLAPLQQAEAIDIRRKSDAFGEKVEDFRKFFQQKAPFSVPGGELKLEHVSGSV